MEQILLDVSKEARGEKDETTSKQEFEESLKRCQKKQEERELSAQKFEFLSAILDFEGKEGEEPINSKPLVYQVSEMLPSARCPAKLSQETSKLSKLDHDSHSRSFLLSRKFQEIPISFVSREVEVVVLDSSITIPEALDALAFAGILAAPVKKRDIIIGMIDVADLVGEVLRILRQHHNKNSNHMERIFKHTTIEDVLDTRGGEQEARNAYKWSPLKSSDNLFNALRLMGTGIHRTPVTSNEGHKLMGILSQSDVPKLISKYPHLLEGEYQVNERQTFRLSQLPIGYLPTLKRTSNILKISAQSPTWLAMETLDSQHVSALAVVDDPLSLHPKLVGTFSTNHIKALTVTTFHYLLLPVEKFLTVVDSDKTHWSGARCGLDYPLLEVIRKLASTSVPGGSHRIWVTEADGTLLGLLTLTDILHFLFSL